MMRFYETLSDPVLFGPHFSDPSFQMWKTVAKVVSGVDTSQFTDQELHDLYEITQRRSFPRSLKQLWLLIGRRGGKSRFVSPLALWLACFPEWRSKLSAGEFGVGMIICPDRKQSRVIRNYIVGLIRSSPMIQSMVENITSDSIIFTNGDPNG